MSKQAFEALPPVPLSDGSLEPLLDSEKVKSVHVPKHRPDVIKTPGMVHKGNILDFYIETESKFVKCVYENGSNGMLWKRCDPWHKNESNMEILQRDLADYDEL